jgi:tyramine---L-glutamate ligase
MRVVIFEHFSALPEGGAPAALVAEGRAMRDAVTEDLARLPGIDVERVARPGHLRAALRRAEAAILIAPETDGRLERLCRLAESERRRLIGPSAEAVRLAGDKLATARCLEAGGIPAPRTESIRFDAAARLLRGVAGPYVLKPRDGCGAQGVVLVREPSDLEPALREVRAATAREDLLIQAFVPGEDASVSVLVGAEDLIALGPSRQRVRRGRSFAYRGGETPWSHRLQGRARSLAAEAVRVLAGRVHGLRGYVGVDLVLGRSGPVVVEVNPRITTSYLGLRRVLKENLAGLMMAAAAGRRLPPRVTVRGRCRFWSDGKAFLIGGRGEGRWPKSTMAGTSAASI